MKTIINILKFRFAVLKLRTYKFITGKKYWCTVILMFLLSLNCLATEIGLCGTITFKDKATRDTVYNLLNSSRPATANIWNHLDYGNQPSTSTFYTMDIYISAKVKEKTMLDKAVGVINTWISNTKVVSCNLWVWTSDWDDTLSTLNDRDMVHITK